MATTATRLSHDLYDKCIIKVGSSRKNRGMILIDQIWATIRFKPRMRMSPRCVLGQFFAKSYQNWTDMGGKNPYPIIMLSI